MDTKHRDAYLQHKPELVVRARQASNHASNHRSFKVGAAALAWSDAWDDGSEPGYRTFVGTNMMPRKDGPKFCAEPAAVSAALAAGAKLIVAIVVAGEPQPDGHSGVDTPTLHPCFLCRNLLSTLPQVEMGTMIFTAHNHEGPTEEHSLAEVLVIHGHRGS